MNSQVKVVAVCPTDPGTLIHSLLQIVLLLQKAIQPIMKVEAATTYEPYEQ